MPSSKQNLDFSLKRQATASKVEKQGVYTSLEYIPKQLLFIFNLTLILYYRKINGEKSKLLSQRVLILNSNIYTLWLYSPGPLYTKKIYERTYPVQICAQSPQTRNIPFKGSISCIFYLNTCSRSTTVCSLKY